MTTKDEIMLILERYDVDPKTHNVIADKILALRQSEQLICPNCKGSRQNFTRNGDHIWCQACDYEFNLV